MKYQAYEFIAERLKSIVLDDSEREELIGLINQRTRNPRVSQLDLFRANVLSGYQRKGQSTSINIEPGQIATFKGEIDQPDFLSDNDRKAILRDARSVWLDAFNSGIDKRLDDLRTTINALEDLKRYAEGSCQQDVV